MPQYKYIGTKDVARLTGLSMDEVYELVHSGKLPSHKTRRGHYRVKEDDVAQYFGIQISKPKEETCSKLQVKIEELRVKSEPKTKQKKPKVEREVSYIADEEHYTQVFKRMTEVESSLKIATGDLKNFNVTIESDEGVEKFRLCDFFLSLVERGVQVQVVCMDPFYFYLNTKKICPQLLDNPLFDLRYNKRNHMKIFIFDDECAYLGSANITGAAIGKRSIRRRNHEAGLLMWGSMMQAPLNHFDKVWNHPIIVKHTWKRFIAEAKKLEKKLELRYGKREGE